MSGRITSITLGFAALLLGAAPATAAAWRPTVSKAPSITGTLQVDAKLTADGGEASGPRGTKIGLLWLRCDDHRCVPILGADERTYTLVPADRGMYLRVVLWAYRDGDFDSKVSSPAGPIGAAPTPTPTPTPTKTPTPTPSPSPSPSPPPSPSPSPAAPPSPPPSAGVAAPAAVATPVAQPPARDVGAKAAKPKRTRPRMMRPYPTIRIRGRLTVRGARISILTVRAPRGVRITLACRGRGCPRHRVARATKLWHIPQFERELRAGTRLTITVSKPGYLTKVTTIRIRRGKVPLRSDRCRAPGATRLTRCPRA